MGNSYASEGSKLIAVTIDEDKGSNRVILALSVLFIVFSGVPLILLALRGVVYEARPPTYDPWVNAGRPHPPHYARWPAETSMRVHDSPRTWPREEWSRPDEAGRTTEEWEPKRTNPHWGELRPAENCIAYGTREYTARLNNLAANQDWKRACHQTKVEIHGTIYDSPARCEDKGPIGGVFGHWLVTSERETRCFSSWRGFSDKGCINEGSHQRRVTARLWNFDTGNWMTMCMSTPAEINGTNFSSPGYCEDQGNLGVYGVWYIDDPTC